MLKNKANVLAGMFLLFVACKDSYAMQVALSGDLVLKNNRTAQMPVRDSWKNLVPKPPIYVDFPPFGGVMVNYPVEFNEKVWKTVRHDMVESLEDAGKTVANLSLVNKEMNQYVMHDEFLHALAEELQKTGISKNHRGLTRALVEGSKQKRLEHELFEIAYPFNGYDGDVKTKLQELFAEGIDINHQFDPRYYTTLYGSCGGAPLTLLCSVQERMENDCVRGSAMHAFFNHPNIKLDVPDSNGKTPLMWSMVNKVNRTAFKALYEEAKKGRDIGVNCTDQDGNTVLTQVAKTQNMFGEKILPAWYKDCILQLVEIGANPFIPNKDGKTAMSIFQQNDPKFAALLNSKSHWAPNCVI